ncbi:acyl dehydratase [Povalibacter uvarum]|uniref:Acyl dehydratase n=1 Tax=Povalibacter uvarum TaxID=732238 RepID=A0A841HH95_9GAMM|nr:MaoC/PaaZ C-terminal domain-containing protein [Povalibacter uvarum]MBB6092043.1 acyl dehydratase [Povalibacter uvarum]
MPLNYENLMNMQFEPVIADYSKKDTILYALGLGVGAADPFDPAELKYVYERKLVALPMMAVTLGAGAMRLADPKFGVNYTMLLHGEQTLQVHKPLPVEGTFISESKIDEIYDKGAAKGAVMYFTRKLYEKASGDLLVTMCNVVFLRADGGFGGKSDGAPKLRAVPSDRPADLQVPIHASLNQALIYRLSGDYNPLHIDPEVAKQAGFDRPILHGLGAYGMVGRALIKALCADDPARMKRLDVRFSSPVYPGEPLHAEVWHMGSGDAAFRLIATNRKVVVEDFGRFEYS